jgi:regulator of cell morphogenesis and NO signaling
MDHFKADDKVAKLIHANHYLLPVINRFGIRLGFKDKTVAQVCTEKNIDSNFFLAIINTYTNEDYFPEQDLLKFSPELLIDYLRKTHRYYFEYFFPEVEHRLNKVLNSCQGNCGDLQLINTFYQKYKVELTKHLEEEENRVFPYILALTGCLRTGGQMPEQFSNYYIQSREPEHTMVDQKIYDLKNILIKYLEANYDDNLCNTFLFAIFQFERDLVDHARIEDKILVPKVVEIEKMVQHG